jgi:hypothetical protein
MGERVKSGGIEGIGGIVAVGVEDSGDEGVIVWWQVIERPSTRFVFRVDIISAWNYI